MSGFWIPTTSEREEECGQHGCKYIIPPEEQYYFDPDTGETCCERCYSLDTLSPDEKAGL